MKDKGLRLFQWILLLAVLLVCMTACVITARGPGAVMWVDESHPGPRHAYYYYPDESIYFDPGLSLYYWHENDGWHHDRRSPRHIVSKRRVRFDSDADRPYLMHDKVSERYRPGERPGRPPEKRQKEMHQKPPSPPKKPGPPKPDTD
jgi:hypothetical protein